MGSIGKLLARRVECEQGVLEYWWSSWEPVEDEI